MIVGGKAPDFTLFDHTGDIRTLSGYLANGPVVLFFFPLASSPICTAQACHFRDLGREFGQVGAQRLGVSTDSVDKQARFAEQRSFDFPLLSDVGGVMSHQFGVHRGVLDSTRKPLLRRQAVRSGRHSRRRGLIARLLPLRRTTFVIDTDRTVLKIIRSEVRAFAHADRALDFLINEYTGVPETAPEIRLEVTPEAETAIESEPAAPVLTSEPPVLPRQRRPAEPRSIWGRPSDVT